MNSLFYSDNLEIFTWKLDINYWKLDIEIL